MSVRGLTALLLLASAVSAAGPLGAQEQSARGASDGLAGRHCLAIHAGVLSRATVATGVAADEVVTSTRVGGFAGALSYGWWGGETWRIGARLGFVDAASTASVTPGTVRSSTALVTSIMAAFAWSPGGWPGARTRPLVSLAAGTFTGSASGTRIEAGGLTASDSVSDSVPAVRAAAGIDTRLGRRMLVELEVAWNFAPEFAQTIGDSRDYSGPEAVLGLGVLIGGPR